MDGKVYTLEEVEGFCLGQLSGAEQSAFEQQLLTDVELQGRVGLMQSILDGFAAIQAETFIGKMDSWAQEQEEADAVELIDCYLSGELGGRAIQYVENKRKSEPSFAALFTAQQALFEGFEAIRTSDFAQQMSQWEEERPAKGPIKKLRPWGARMAIAASILLLLGVGGWAYMKGQYSNEKLFVAFYQSPNIGGTLGGQTLDQFREQFGTAHRHLAAQEYVEAIAQLQVLQVSISQLELDPLARSYYEDNLEWSLLLARLGNDQVDPNDLQRLRAIAAETAHEYQGPAQELLTKLTSIWR